MSWKWNSSIFLLELRKKDLPQVFCRTLNWLAQLSDHRCQKEYLKCKSTFQMLAGKIEHTPRQGSSSDSIRVVIWICQSKYQLHIFSEETPPIVFMMAIIQEWGKTGRRNLQFSCSSSWSREGGAGEEMLKIKSRLFKFLSASFSLHQVMVNQYYVVYRNILQSVLPAVIVLFIGDRFHD